MKEIIKYGSIGSAPVEWIVLEVWEKERKALVISKYGLFYGYFDKEGNPSWAQSSVRKFLNNKLIPILFSEEEQQGILPVKLPREETDLLESDDYDSYDCLFFLSEKEATRFFESDDADEERKTCCMDNSEEDSFDDWWLRSRIAGENTIAYVTRTGRIPAIGHSADDKTLCMRPAFYLDLSSFSYYS